MGKINRQEVYDKCGGKCGGSFKYLDGKSINQILRDIEGFLIYKIHTSF